MQCHGTQLVLDAENRPVDSTWPNMGMGNIYPDGSTGNCASCHTRHRFSIVEARKPEACAACHLGPDHPDIEIYENSKHGQIYATEGEDWVWDSAPDTWEPGDYRAPTCATCHMSGIGELSTTHNITERLYWNLWATTSDVRNSTDVLSPLLGTPFFSYYLRIMGCKVGKHVFIDTHLLGEFDLVEIGDHAALNFDVVVQNHLFEDRVLKSSNLVIADNCSIGNMSVILYDSRMDEGASVDSLFLVMKGEYIPPRSNWVGIPIQRK